MNSFNDILPDITEPSIVHSVDLADTADAAELLSRMILEGAPTCDDDRAATAGAQYLLNLVVTELRRVNKAGIERGEKLRNDIASGLLILTDATEGDVECAET